MGVKERQEREREAVARAILDAARELFVAEGLPERLHSEDRREDRVQPGSHLRLFPEQGRHLSRARRGGVPAPVCVATDFVKEPPSLDSIRSGFQRFYEFSKTHPEYFALMFVDRQRPADQPRLEPLWVRARDARNDGTRYPDGDRCGRFPGRHAAARGLPDPDGGGPRRRVMRLCDRLSPGEDPDALARDTLEAALTGLRRVGITHSNLSSCIETAVEVLQS